MQTVMRVGMALLVGTMQFAVQRSAVTTAEGATTPQLVISEFKVTTNDGQFFTLYNPTSTAVNLSSFELEYFNNNDLTKATSTKLIPLSGTILPNQYYMLSDGTATICYQVTVDTVSLGFSTTSGFVELLQLPPQTTPGSLVSPIVTDYAGWSKKTTSGNDVLTVSPSGSTVTVPNSGGSMSITWLRQLPVQTSGANAWQPVRPDPNNACSLQLVQSGGTVGTQTIVNPGNQLSVGEQPPATVVSLGVSTSSTPALPAADIGLAAPQITELLPNPDGTGTDSTDEFIELYNSATTSFDLSGFTLQTGTTTKHSFVFPDETMLPPKSFTAFYSADTGLTLSNTSGQAALLDPFGNLLSQTDSYGAAKDGQAWVLADDKWYWTANPTPNAANLVKQPASSSVASAKAKSGGKTVAGHVQGATTTTGNGGAANLQATPAPIHPLVLAAIGILAVGYGIYEYRHDLANKLYELRRDRSFRRAARS
ncbi:MAG TPA: lamin tail domain-containing protein [Candidatus Saccharimonadales bacterium]|nr:lamin tail domain-containing protein [Candidatus Saccharimonadales bacterium]